MNDHMTSSIERRNNTLHAPTSHHVFLTQVRLASLERKLEEAERRERQHAMDQKKAKEEEEKLKRENDRLRQLEAQDMIDQVERVHPI